MEPGHPLVVIVGPTASGKTALAIDLAKQFSGEIICADSRTVYRGMDISTAKPTVAEQQAAVHHLLDVVEPDERFTVADFKQLANDTIRDITDRGKLPILAGGSGLFVDAVLYDFGFSTGEGRDATNPRHAAPETAGTRGQLKPNTLLIGLKIESETLRGRIAARVDTMIRDGLLDEIKSLTDKYGWELPAFQTPALKSFKDYYGGKITLDEAKQRFITADYQLAKRQMTWFKRNNSIQWLDGSGTAAAIVSRFLNKKKVD